MYTADTTAHTGFLSAQKRQKETRNTSFCLGTFDKGTLFFHKGTLVFLRVLSTEGHPLFLPSFDPKPHTLFDHRQHITNVHVTVSVHVLVPVNGIFYRFTAFGVIIHFSWELISICASTFDFFWPISICCQHGSDCVTIHRPARVWTCRCCSGAASSSFAAYYSPRGRGCLPS